MWYAGTCPPCDVSTITPIYNSLSLDAKHANNKGAKKASHDRPKKSRPSDINRKPVVYPTYDIPTSEYTILDTSAGESSVPREVASKGSTLKEEWKQLHLVDLDA